MLHWSYKYVDAIVTDRVVSSVWSVTIMSPAKMTEPIEIQYRLHLNSGGHKEPLLDRVQTVHANGQS